MAKDRLPLAGAILLTFAVLAVRFWYASQVRFCGTPDSCFYLGLAQGMERTGSSRVNFLYDLLLPRLHLPNAGIEYWRPGTSFLLLPAHWIGGVSLGSSACMASLAGVVWAAAAWHAARRFTATRGLALACYGLALLLPAAWTGSQTPDSTLFYAAAVAWFLALFTVERQGLRQDLLALGCVAVAYLIRNDAVLLLFPLLVVLCLRFRARVGAQGRGGTWPGAEVAPSSSGSLAGNSGGRLGGRLGGSSPLYAACMLAGFFVALFPMHLLYRRVLGTAFPGGMVETLWLYDLSDFNVYGATPTAASLLAHGAGHLLVQRAEALLLILYRVPAILVGYPALLFLSGLLLAPRFALRRNAVVRSSRLRALAGPLTFTITLLLVYGFVLPAVGVFAALRSVVGVLPSVTVLVVAGLERTVREERLRERMCVALLAIYAVSGFLETRREVEANNRLGDRDRRLAARLKQMGARADSSVVMTGDPVQFAVTTGFATVPVPGNGLDAARAEARALGVTHVMLDSNRLPATEEESARVLGAVRRVRWPEEGLVLLELEGSTP